MNKERELLERALQLIDDAYEGQIALSLCNEIQELLAQPEQEPVAWMQDDIELYVQEEKDIVRGYVIPLYTSPPEQEPVVLQYRTKANYGGYEWSRWIDCSKEFYERREKTPLRNGFCYEVRKAHGIGEKNDPS
jgi:hypothetical protein